jgi:hypothetical protein
MDTLLLQFWGFQASASGTLAILALTIIIVAVLLFRLLSRRLSR